MIRIIFRNSLFIYSLFINRIKLIKLKILYKGFTFAGKTIINRNCDIRCTKGSKIILTNAYIGSGTQMIADHGAIIDITDTYIGPNCVIVARSGIKIHKNSQIAEMVTIRDQNHKFGEIGKTIVEQGFDSERIDIGENVWIASKSTILKGVVIGDNVVIGAHSLVNKSCENNKVYAGTPAREISPAKN